MKVLLAIPSKARPYDLKNTLLRWLPEINTEWRVFVEPHEFIHYRTTIPKGHVVNIGKDEQGIGYAMWYIGQYAHANGFDLVCRIDDDCSGFISKHFSDGKSGHSADVFDKAIADISPDFENDPSLGAVRFLDPKLHIYEAIGKARKYTHRDCELYHGWIIRTETLFKINENVKHNDDVYLYLHTLKAGLHTLLYGRIGVQFKDGTNKGGFQTLDRSKLTEETLAYMLKDFPALKLKSIDRWYKVDIDVSAYSRKTPL